MEDLSLHILDIVENSIEAGARRIKIMIDEDILNNRLMVKVKDNGCGMDKKTLARVLDPFYTTKKVRRVGLGLSLLAQAAKEADGNFSIKSARGKGTEVVARFVYDHIDRRPLGNMAETILALITPVREVNIDFVYEHRVNDRVFSLDTRSIKKDLAGVEMSHPAVVRHIRTEIGRKLQELKGAQDEEAENRRSGKT